MLNCHFSIYLGAHIVPAIIGFFAITAYTRLLNPGGIRRLRRRHERRRNFRRGLFHVDTIVGLALPSDVRGRRLSRHRDHGVCADRSGDLQDAPFTVLLFHPNFSVNVLAAGMFVAVAVGAFEIGQEFERARLEAVPLCRHRRHTKRAWAGPRVSRDRNGLGRHRTDRGIRNKLALGTIINSQAAARAYRDGSAPSSFNSLATDCRCRSED